MRFVTQVHINKPPDIVNKAYTDPDNMPYWTKHLERFEVVKGNSEEVGALITLKWTGRGRSTPFNPLLFLLRGEIKREATSELIEFKNLVETYGIKFS